MDLRLTPEDEAFREEVRAFLAEKLTPELKARAKLIANSLPEHSLRHEWLQILNAKGWAAPYWPKEYGGPGWTVMQRYIFSSECATAGTPVTASMGLMMIGPTLMGHGTPEQKAYYLPRILSGDDWWCQGYSEPGAGSDLAGLGLKAVTDGDHFVLNGTKLWTTGAHYANKMFCLVRTDTSGKPQQGITFILIDEMNQPGIKVEPIITLGGDREVNQVFFDDVRVPKKNIVGKENDGWTVAKYLLEFERGGSAYGGTLNASLKELNEIASLDRGSDGKRLIDDPAFRRKLDETDVEVMALHYTELRIMSELAGGKTPGATSSIMKTRGTEMMQRLGELRIEAGAYYSLPHVMEARTWIGHVPPNTTPVGPDHHLMAMPVYLNDRAASIYAGSNEIQRNIMSKAVLGL
jgi:alkylation response protein AidB-like acyl-CoA dehydrogenase